MAFYLECKLLEAFNLLLSTIILLVRVAISYNCNYVLISTILNFKFSSYFFLFIVIRVCFTVKWCSKNVSTLTSKCLLSCEVVCYAFSSRKTITGNCYTFICSKLCWNISCCCKARCIVELITIELLLPIMRCKSYSSGIDCQCTINLIKCELLCNWISSRILNYRISDVSYYCIRINSIVSSTLNIFLGLRSRNSWDEVIYAALSKLEAIAILCEYSSFNRILRTCYKSRYCLICSVILEGIALSLNRNCKRCCTIFYFKFTKWCSYSVVR